MSQQSTPLALLAAALAGAVALAGCGENTRKAEVETAGAEAEVTTKLPESQVSDQQLQNTAEGAAAAAATPQAGASVVVTPPPTGEAAPAGAPAGSAPAQ